MRIVLNGQQAFGKSVLEALLDRGEDVVAVYGPPDDPKKKPDPLVAAARERGIKLLQPKSFKKPEVWAEFEALKPDLQVMAFVTLFVPEDFLNIPTHGSIQYHPSILPRHRGPSAINWAIIMGDKTTGLSIFWPDNGLDTGPLLMTKEVDILPDDTVGSVYFDKLFPLGIEAMMESVDLVREGKAPKLVQDESGATYESFVSKDQARIDWSKPVDEVYNLIRGTDPQPGGWCIAGDEDLKLFDARKTEGTDGAPGEIVAVGEDGITIAAKGGQIRIGRIRAGKGQKVDAAEYAAEAGLTAGTRLE